jgi:hypothetical protein
MYSSFIDQMSKREEAQTAAFDFGTASIARIKMAASPMSPLKRPDFLRQGPRLSIGDYYNNEGMSEPRRSRHCS